MRRARFRVPLPGRLRQAQVFRAGDRLVLTFDPAGRGEFLPIEEELVEPGDPPSATVSGSVVQWSQKLGRRGKALKTGESVAGVWVPVEGRPLAIELHLR
jgi:hypothetical protein